MVIDEDSDSLNQYKFKQLPCKEEKEKFRIKMPRNLTLWSVSKLLVSCLTLLLVVVILCKIPTQNTQQVPPRPSRSGQPLFEEHDFLNYTKIALPIHHQFQASSLHGPLENQSYIVMPLGSKFALTVNSDGNVNISQYTFETNQLFTFKRKGRTSPKKYIMTDKTKNYVIGLEDNPQGDQAKIVAFEKNRVQPDSHQWLIRDQTHREGSFQLIPARTEMCLAFKKDVEDVVQEECAPFVSSQYWLMLPICENGWLKP